MGVFENFAISFIANNFPTIKDAVSYLGKDTSLGKELERCYQKALKKWCKNDGIRKSMSLRLFQSLENLKSYLQREEHIYERELIVMWADELRNNELCYKFILEQKVDAISDKACQNNDLIRSLNNKADEILVRMSNPVALRPKKGLLKHKLVEGYIRRYCTDEQDGNNYLRYLLGTQERYTLGDYVTSEICKENNKFIVYSGAQTGKTTELKNLCWELQKSGLFVPVSYEVKSSHDLRQEDMPQTGWIDGKEVVVIIDALDEINGKEREDLLKTINSFAHDNPDMKMVLSCRSNYRRDDQLNAFHELYIESMSYEDIKAHIKHETGERNTLWRMIVEQELVDFAKQPFFLNVLIGSYKEGGTLPKDRNSLYKLFIERSYKTEKKEKGTLPEYRVSSEEMIAMLERVAVAMSLMNRQVLTESEFGKCLEDDNRKIDECRRYSVIKFEDDVYSFAHNAFREWLTATYLYNKGLAMAKQLASLPNGRIKPEWYNIIMLWMGMYDPNEKEKVRENIEWLRVASMDLIIYADSSSLDQDAKDNIFISILQEYKNLGIRMSNILADDYRDMLRFGQSNATVEYIAEEMSEAEPGTAYYADLMCMCYFLNWTVAEKSSEEVFSKLLGVLDGISLRNLEKKPTGDLQYLYLGNEFFYKEKYVKKYYNLFKDSINYDAIKVIISLIHRTGLVDEYVNYILEKEHYVQDQREGNTTRVVSRDEVYVALGTVERADSIEKILRHEFKNFLYYYDSEWSQYRDMVINLLQKAAKQMKKGINQPLLSSIEVSYLRTFPNIYHHTHEHQDILVGYRDFYGETGIAKTEKDKFDEIEKTGFGDFESKDNIKQIFLKTGLWLTKEDLDDYYSKMNPDRDVDRWWAGWLRGCPYMEMANYASEKYSNFFPETEYEKKSRLRHQDHFNSLADYDVFKQRVLEILDRTETDSQDGLEKVMKEDDENPWNSYVYQFYEQYIRRDGSFLREDVVKAINDKAVYDSFFMMVVKNSMHVPFQAASVDDKAIKRMTATAKSVVEDIGRGFRCEWEFEEVALKLLLEGYFTVGDDILIKLIPLSELSVSKDMGRGFHESYTLFEYIEEKVGQDKLGHHVILLLRDINKWKDSSTGFRLADYVIKNRISDGYQLVFEYITNGCRNDEYLVEHMLKNGIMVEELKAASRMMEVSLRLALYTTLSRDLGDIIWVKEQLEPWISVFEGYEQKQALRILLGIGSIEALAFIVEHSELLNDYREYNFCYADINAATLLVQVLDICHQNKYNFDYTNTSIITSLERIAVLNEESLNEVKRVIRDLISKDAYYKYLNRYLIQFENKYFESHSPIKSIEQVIGIMDYTNMENVVELKDDVTPVYISYSWEKNSDNIVNHFCYVLTQKGIVYKRDKKDCSYLDNIKEFMNSIRNGETIIVVFSRKYMLSKNCMYELSGIMKHKGWQKRILPVVVDDSIRERSFYKELVRHWKGQINELEKETEDLKEFGANIVAPIEEELNECKTIFGFLPDLKRYVDWVNADSLNNLSSTNFKVLIDEIKETK